MIVLIIGTENSGKSEMAENIVCELADSNSRIYLATMIAYDAAGKARIEKHRKAREGKGFDTIEIPYCIENSVKLIDNAKNKTVLLECISNLVGNEIYENQILKNDKSESAEKAQNIDKNIKLSAVSQDEILVRIISGISELAAEVENLVIVTNKYKIENSYDIETVRYIEMINKVNEKLIDMADNIKYVGIDA